MQMGDELLTSAWSKGDRELRSPVAYINLRTQEGLFNPHTVSGSIVVNGVAATAFTDALQPSTAVYATVMLPLRVLSFLIPSKSMAMAFNDAVLDIYFNSLTGPGMLRSLLGAGVKL